MMIAFMTMNHLLSPAQNADIRLVEKRHDTSLAMTRYSETPYALKQHNRVMNPAIAAMVSAINEDTLRTTLREMGNWGSRFLMNDNKKEIAISLMNKFLSYGYTDVKLDSFYLIIQNWSGFSDSSWQYNIVCTLRGSSAPDEIYVVGGHWDSICLTDPVNDAPGVDDNGTAVAATLEIARLMKLYDYTPEATIQFTLFAAEELGLHGSRYASYNARFEGTDIRYMLNMDMISNNPDNLPQVKIYQYLSLEWAALAAAEATERYTDLSVVFPQDNMNSGSDSYPYWAYGFPSAYFEEIVFSPNWHKVSDTLGNCNVPYLKKVTGGVLATLLEQQMLPYPQNLWAQSDREGITLNWQPTKNSFIKGCNIYRSEVPGGNYQKITTSPVTDSVYHDAPAVMNKQYYYVITTVNDSLQESVYSKEVSGARFNFCDTLLVVANVKGTKTTPDSIRAFYHAVFDTIPYKWMDVNATQKIELTQFSRYRSIMWMSNSLDYEPLTDDMYDGIWAFKENGGNLLFSGFSPSRFWMYGSITYPLYVPEMTIFHELFKVDTVDRKLQSMLCGANSVSSGYNSLHLDSLKYMDKNYPGQLYNIDVFAPSGEANVIYRFDTRYDSTTSFGKMKHRPVGLEYMGTDFKSILLSFPLYYLDTADAREFMKFVVTKKFSYAVGIHQQTPVDPFGIQLFPNPVTDGCNMKFKLDKPGHVRISVLSLFGQTVATWMDSHLEPGLHSFLFPAADLTPGLYEVLLQQGTKSAVRKIIRIE